MQIDHGGVDIFMSQSVFDVGNGVAATKHIDGPRVAEAVGGVDVLQALWRQHPLKIFFTQPVDPGASECLCALVDKQPMAVKRSWRGSIFLEVQRDQLTGFGPQLNLTEAVTLAQDGQGLVVGIEVV